MPRTERTEPWLRAACAGGFMVPALALWLPSGYSWGAALLLLAALLALPRWWGHPVPREGWWLAACFAAMAVLWLLDARDAQGWSALDRPSRYLLAMPCLFFLLAFPPRGNCLAMGIAVGAAGAGLTGLYQIHVMHLARATGYTNAIQYGNLGLLLSVMSGLWLAAQWRHCPWWQRLLLLAGTVLGLIGSIYSQTRGGWLALLIVVPACGWILLRTQPIQRVLAWSLGLLAAVALLSQTAVVQQRVDQAWQQWQTYASHQDNANSVGYRLDLWRMAWSIGWERPLVGWGPEGFDAQTARRVADGRMPVGALQLHHAHNEVLDVFAKHGVPGVALLLAFYAIPLWLFWPTAARGAGAARPADREALALRLVGLSLPLSYAGFGFTQVFLAHNSGNLFYLFMCMLVLAALHGRRRRLAPP